MRSSHPHRPSPPPKHQKFFRGKLVGSTYIPTADVLGKQNALKKVLDLCKKCSTCPHCDAHNGVVKKVTGLSTLKIVHDPFGSKNEGGVEEMHDMLEVSEPGRLFDIATAG